MAKPQNRRERNKARNLKTITRASYRLFARKGLFRTTLKDISEEADVGKGTIYTYFKTKTNLMTDLTQNAFDDLLEYCRKGIIGTNDPDELLQKLINGHFSFFARRRSLFTLLFFARGTLQQDFSKLDIRKIESSYTKYIDFVGEVLDSGVRTGSFRPFSPVIQAHILEGLIMGFILHWTINKRTGNLADQAGAVVETFFYGIKRNRHKEKKQRETRLI